MAEGLVADRIDLSDPQAAAVALSRRNFGSASIAYCMDQAVEIALGGFIAAPKAIGGCRLMG